MTTAWDVYAKELYHHGHGYPLWVPDLDPTRSQWEVEIGDVGWVRDGTFNHLLRCRGTNEDDQPHQVLPDNYVPFDPPKLVISGPREKITQPVLCSRSIKNIEVSGGVSVNVPLAMSTPGGIIKFQCAEDKGALLLLSPRGDETLIQSRGNIVTYMREHLDNWEQLANNTLGLDLEREDIFFVFGVTKTSRWGVAAFSGTQRNAQGTVSCDFGALGCASMNINIAQTSLPSSWYRSGPPRARESPTESFPSTPTTPYVSHTASPKQHPFGTGPSKPLLSTPTHDARSTTAMAVPTVPQVAPGAPDKADQCIFFHYFKAKRRFFVFERLEAGAGPHELPPSTDEDVADAALLSREGDPAGDDFDFVSTGDSKPYDPVNHALDYILENSEAKLAIASDLDLYALFKGQDFPDDVAAELARSKPAVKLDEHDVGTLSVEDPEGSPSKISATLPDALPSKYRTGKTLGSGTYAIVKEAIHIKTGEYYACKVINKKLMEGREYMVRNEIAVLKKISAGHKNIVTLRDYFETAQNLYLVFDLCTGGELFDRICAKGNYYEEDAAALVRTIFGVVKHIHERGIVHRDLKPENLIFRTAAEDADIMIAEFGLSRVIDDEKFQMLTEICGTTGYMAPEVFKKTGHGKPVDVWAMGVITYFLLCGYTPFDRDTQQEEMEAIIMGNYYFEPEEHWANVSDTAKDFVRACLTIDPTSRPTAAEMLRHKWLALDQRHFVPDIESTSGSPTNILPYIQKAFNARKTLRKAVLAVIATKSMASLAGLSPTKQRFKQEIAELKEESEKEQVGREVVRRDALRRAE